MGKALHYEKLYINATWMFIAVGAVLSVVSNIAGDRYPQYDDIYYLLYFAFVGVLNLLKRVFLLKIIANSNIAHFLARVSEIVILLFGIVFVDIGQWFYLCALFSVIASSLSRGSKYGYRVLLTWIVVNTAMYWIDSLINPTHVDSFKDFLQNGSFSNMVFYCLIGFLSVIFCGMLYRDIKNREKENKKLYEHLEEKYCQLAAVQEELKIQNKTLTEINLALKESNARIEENNKKLTSSVAEFYTMQEISRAIGSIFNTKELLKHVNDIIIGVMGVSYSTILLYDDIKGRLKVNTTNLKSHSEFIALNDNINCDILLNCFKNGSPIMENCADEETYCFIKGRDVKSFICVPLSTKSRMFGLVLVEHKYFNAFDEGNLRLLTVIGQQVGIAIENAALYQKMQEMATIDGLTGVYNRLYFQERLQKEFVKAKNNNYKLSLAIFDIDHFKKFNDTYGHLFGDMVLKSIAQLVKESVRSSDVVARFGGEEFIILFPRTNLREACEKVENLRKKIASAYIKDNGVSATITVSFGVSCFPESSFTENELISHADDALYEAKANGRNCVKASDVIEEYE